MYNGFLQYETISGKAQRQARKAKRKEKRKNKPKLFKKIALAVPRNAFLALVALNVNQMAVKLYNKIKTPDGKEAMRSKWTKLGGNFSKLENTVLKKVKKKGIAGFYDEPGGDNEQPYIGVAVSALLASALPIIKALAEFLGKKKDDSVEVTEDGLVDTSSTEMEDDIVQGTSM